MRFVWLLIPFVIVVAMATIFYGSLQQSKDPFASQLIGKPVPEFSLPALTTQSPDFIVPPALASSDLEGRVTLVNVFASWCVACRHEHPLLMQLARANIVPIMGLNWKDEPGDGAQWLLRFGNPYTQIGDDQMGRTAIDFGVTGAPETFVIDHKGRVRHKHTGPITADDWRTTLGPLVRDLQQKAQAAR